MYAVHMYLYISSLHAQLLIPEETPLDKGVDFDHLAHYEMTGGNIKSVVFRAASRAALRGEGMHHTAAPHPHMTA